MAATVWIVSNLIVGITSLIIIYILLKHGSTKIHYTWAFFNSAVCIWGFSAFLIGLAKDSSTALIYWKIAFIGAIPSSTVFYHVIVVLGELKRKILLTIFYLYCFIFYFLFFFDIAGSKLTLIYNNSLYYVRGTSLGYGILISIWVSIIFLALVELSQLFIKSSGNKRLQYLYLLIGFSTGFTGGIINILPFFGFNVFPFGNILVCFYCILATYAIVKHQLMDITIVIKKGLVYSILAAVVTAIFFAILLITEKLFQGLVGYQSLIVTAIVGFIITLGFNPLKNQIQRFIDRRFFKGTMEEMVYQNEKLMQQIQQADKLKAVSTLAAGMAHEIKNPLTAVKTFSQYLPQKYTDVDFINRYSQIVPKEIERINRIVADVLLFSKPKEPVFKEVNINNLLSETLDFLSNDFLNKNIKVIKEFSPNHSVIFADPDQMKQVFLNLFLNAIDAMDYGGTLTVEVRDGDTLHETGTPFKIQSGFQGKSVPNLRKVSPQECPQSLEVSVQDTGCGISEENLKHLFEPFFTTKDKGTGLGLAVVKHIITNHQGTIKAESEVGKGTKFIVRFRAVSTNETK